MSSASPMRARGLVLLTLALAGCDADASAELEEEDTSELPTSEAEIELGLGPVDWRALEEGDPVELVAGLQGGWHVDLAVRGEGLEPGGLWLRYEARDPSTGAALSYVTEALLDEGNVLETDEGWLRVGDRVVFTIDGPEVVVGAEVCLFVTVTKGSWEDEDSRCVTIVDELGS
ncbi:hypothetical protein G6O69_18695 [Pseudenhygromyxa sp. WMMC2535]|uniref:hypothetical protein n=1 Tax=Pseudenhygromyxa sp. WMMC2535 TaxID=2712867 RepID=UPI0015541353|nr:hypothetical protein [Pseudenhygromyxa sp. WMMC2535]NVB39879.1 hypothetical protein [Pseudenhygromyxa sp. WMMC2535]